MVWNRMLHDQLQISALQSFWGGPISAWGRIQVESSPGPSPGQDSIMPLFQWRSSCCKATIRSTKVGGYLMYLSNSNGVLLMLILSCCEDESILLLCSK
jgi:hypothetical protein